MSHALRSQAIYAYIVQFRQQNDMSPTMREIAAACDIPLTAIFRHLDWLETRGYISRDNTSRSIRLLKPFLTDEEQVYACLVRAIQVNDIAPSLNALRKASRLPAHRFKTALHNLEQAGCVQVDREDPHLFYPLKLSK